MDAAKGSMPEDRVKLLFAVMIGANMLSRAADDARWVATLRKSVKDATAERPEPVRYNRDRYVMITFPTSQIQNPVHPRRPSIRHRGARANMPLQRQRRHRSSWLTADTRTCDRPIMRRNVVSQQTHRRRMPSRTSVARKLP
jgi:hypothetical protein